MRVENEPLTAHNTLLQITLCSCLAIFNVPAKTPIHIRLHILNYGVK